MVKARVPTELLWVLTSQSVGFSVNDYREINPTVKHGRMAPLHSQTCRASPSPSPVPVCVYDSMHRVHHISPNAVH